jgi:hypothetical protein
LGFTICFQWSFPMACCVDVNALKEMTQGKKRCADSRQRIAFHSFLFLTRISDCIFRGRAPRLGCVLLPPVLFERNLRARHDTASSRKICQRRSRGGFVQVVLISKSTGNPFLNIRRSSQVKVASQTAQSLAPKRKKVRRVGYYARSVFYDLYA